MGACSGRRAPAPCLSAGRAWRSIPAVPQRPPSRTPHAPGALAPAGVACRVLRGPARRATIAAAAAAPGGYTCALIFDCDGVIVETEELHRLAYNGAFQARAAGSQSA